MMRLNAEELRQLATALDALTDTTRTTGVRIGVYTRESMQIGSVTPYLDWDEEAQHYVADFEQL